MFFAFDSTGIGNDVSTCCDLCVLGGDCSTVDKNNSQDNAHTFDLSSRGEKLGEQPITLVQCAQRTSGSLDGSAGHAITSVASWCQIYNRRPNQSGGWGPTPSKFSPHPPGFPHTMLNVKRVKDNMQQAFIEKFFTNHEIGTSVQTRYLHFKGMSYESEKYLCDIS